MDISTESTSQCGYTILGNRYILINKIGKGATSKIYIGYDINDTMKTIFAFKIINPSIPQKVTYYQKETLSLKQLNHPNIVKFYECGSSTMQKPSGKIKLVFYIKLEYFKNGQLFDYIYFSKQGLGENLAKVAMHYIINALDHMHSKNLVHRDLKTENIMIDDYFNIKLVDFGFSEVRNKYSSGILSTYLGTTSYASPELLAHKQYYGVSNDIFAVGVIMFVLVTGNMPFRIASPKDPHYSLICKGDYESYWVQRDIQVSNEFKDLFCSLVAQDYTQRPSLSEIKKSKWMTSINYEDLSELKKVLKKRKNICQKKLKLNCFCDNDQDTNMNENNPFFKRKKKFFIQKMKN